MTQYKIEFIKRSTVTDVTFVDNEQTMELDDDAEVIARAKAAYETLPQDCIALRAVRLNEKSDERHKIWDELIALPEK